MANVKPITTKDKIGFTALSVGAGVTLGYSAVKMAEDIENIDTTTTEGKIKYGAAYAGMVLCETGTLVAACLLTAVTICMWKTK